MRRPSCTTRPFKSSNTLAAIYYGDHILVDMSNEILRLGYYMHIAQSLASYLPRSLSDETRDELRYVNKLELELYTLHGAQEIIQGLMTFQRKKSGIFCGIFEFFKGLEELRIVIRERWDLGDNTEDEQRCIKAYAKVLENCISNG